jgi:hypothetical protein
VGAAPLEPPFEALFDTSFDASFDTPSGTLGNAPGLWFALSKVWFVQNTGSSASVNADESLIVNKAAKLREGSGSGPAKLTARIGSETAN